MLFYAPPSPRHKAGVRGTITRFVTTIQGTTAVYHFYELDVADLDQDWLESKERRREWVDYPEAIRRLQWKAELAQGLSLSSLAPPPPLSVPSSSPQSAPRLGEASDVYTLRPSNPR